MRIKSMELTPYGHQTKITIMTEDNCSHLYDLIDKPLSIDIKQYYPKRSLDANAYMWKLIRELAMKLQITRKEVYQQAIKEAGYCDVICVKNEAAEQFIKTWEDKGYGFLADIEESKIDGCKRVFIYYGTSTYDSKQMGHIIDYIIEECKAQGIETMPPDELAKLNKYSKEVKNEPV